MIRKAWAVIGLGLGVMLAGERDGRAQGLLPPAPGVNLGQVARRMAEALRDLSDDVSAANFTSPAAQYLARDCRELHRSVEEWHEANRGLAEPHHLRRSYAGIDLSWHRLRDQLAAPGVATPAIAEEIRRVDQADATIHQALNLNAIPPNLEGQAGAPTGMDEARRLSYAIAQRGEAVAAQVRAFYEARPGAGGLIEEAAGGSRAADGFADAMNNPAAPLPLSRALETFPPVNERSYNLGLNLDRSQVPPTLKGTYHAYMTALYLTRDCLIRTFNGGNPGAAAPPAFAPPPPAAGAIPYNPNPAPQVTQWAEGLDRQVDDLIAHFAPTAGVVPEGREMLGEMERLRNDVRMFRDRSARGLDAGRLAFEFRQVDADWQRLARQVNRIARGRTGPNIQRVQQIGQTCEQIHQALGMPGYPPIITPY